MQKYSYTNNFCIKINTFLLWKSVGFLQAFLVAHFWHEQDFSIRKTKTFRLCWLSNIIWLPSNIYYAYHLLYLMVKYALVFDIFSDKKKKNPLLQFNQTVHCELHRPDITLSGICHEFHLCVDRPEISFIYLFVCQATLSFVLAWPAILLFLYLKQDLNHGLPSTTWYNLSCLSIN